MKSGGLLLMAALVTAGGAFGQSKKTDGSAPDGDLALQVARLEREVASLRQVVTYLLQDQQQKATLFLQILQGAGVPPVPKAIGLAESSQNPMTEGVEMHQPVPAASPAKGLVKAPKAPPVISGVVTSSGGTLPPGTYVYVDEPGAPMARNKYLEIRQQNKQFIPAAAVVQKGTRLIFPNYDAVFHNVFSPSPGNAFDLGSYQAGDKPRSVMVTTPGVVEIFCNIHSRMAASVLVVSSSNITTVDALGRFRFEGVAPGKRTLVVWAPDSDPVSKTIDVGNELTDVKLTIEPGHTKAHVNKHGQPYGSYAD